LYPVFQSVLEWIVAFVIRIHIPETFQFHFQFHFHFHFLGALPGPAALLLRFESRLDRAIGG